MDYQATPYYSFPDTAGLSLPCHQDDPEALLSGSAEALDFFLQSLEFSGYDYLPRGTPLQEDFELVDTYLAPCLSDLYAPEIYDASRTTAASVNSCCSGTHSNEFQLDNATHASTTCPPLVLDSLHQLDGCLHARESSYSSLAGALTTPHDDPIRDDPAHRPADFAPEKGGQFFEGSTGLNALQLVPDPEYFQRDLDQDPPCASSALFPFSQTSDLFSASYSLGLSHPMLHLQELTFSARRNASISDPLPAPLKLAQLAEGESCPFCPYRKRPGRRKQELKRHIQSHYHSTRLEAALWVCCGVPEEDADAHGLPAAVREREDRRMVYAGKAMVGGCKHVFSRRDALLKHLRASAGRCFGDPYAPYLRGNLLGAR
ncbi:hypothetical protein BD413DRAFT_611381 [Trametes elegans]|nr:hypothetical protein BD413DRAFT_611381 [Trametes elegans]